TRSRTRRTNRNFRAQMWVILASAAKEDAGFAKSRVATATGRANFSFVMMSTPIARCGTQGTGLPELRACPLAVFGDYRIDPDATAALWAVLRPRSARLKGSSVPGERRKG